MTPGKLVLIILPGGREISLCREMLLPSDSTKSLAVPFVMNFLKLKEKYSCFLRNQLELIYHGAVIFFCRRR
jgi:hypothetical protein